MKEFTARTCSRADWISYQLYNSFLSTRKRPSRRFELLIHRRLHVEGAEYIKMVSTRFFERLHFGSTEYVIERATHGRLDSHVPAYVHVSASFNQIANPVAVLAHLQNSNLNGRISRYAETSVDSAPPGRARGAKWRATARQDVEVN